MAVAVSKGVADLIKAKLEEACYEVAHEPGLEGLACNSRWW